MYIDFALLTPQERQSWLSHVVVPRPIAIVSTISLDGRANLAPFSFFTIVAAEPPLLLFSVQRRLRDATTKHTIENIREVPELVIHICAREMVEQASLCSNEFGRGVDEFLKAGFVKGESRLVKPVRIADSPVAIECKVKQIIPLGEQGGSADLVLAEVVCMEIAQSLLSIDETTIDPFKWTLASRLGGPWYGEMSPDKLFVLPKPERPLAIGVDQLPQFVVSYPGLTGRHLAMLAGVSKVPEADPAFTDHGFDVVSLLEEGKVDSAWQLLFRINTTPARDGVLQ